MINIIASGSKGNAVIYHNELLVDIGVAYTHLEPYLADIRYILLTHEHKDHINITSLKRALKEYQDIEVICANHMLEKVKSLEYVIPINNNEWLMLDGYQIASIDLKHDVENIGYRIYKELPDFELNKGIHATDMYSLDGVIAEDCDWYAIELNHCEELIQQAIKTKENAGVFAYERYSQNNHHSNQRGFAWLDQNNVDGLVIPLHISGNVGNVRQIKKEIDKRGWKSWLG